MTITESYYALYDKQTNRFLTPLMDWNEKFMKAKRIFDLKEATYLFNKERNAFNDVQILICQATIEAEQV